MPLPVPCQLRTRPEETDASHPTDYTIRELTNHAAELFALKAMQGEILTSGDPYTIPQKGFNHAWDAHGGGAYLHEHLVDVSTATVRHRAVA